MTPRSPWWAEAQGLLASDELAVAIGEAHAAELQSEYSDVVERAPELHTSQADGQALYSQLTDILVSASMEILAGGDPSESDLQTAFERLGRAFFYLARNPTLQLERHLLLLQSAGTFALGGYSANAHVALSARAGDPNFRWNSAGLALCLGLLLERRMPELRTLARELEAGRFSRVPRGLERPAAAFSGALRHLGDFTLLGRVSDAQAATSLAREFSEYALGSMSADTWLLARLFELNVSALISASTWTVLGRHANTALPIWRSYVRNLALGVDPRRHSSALGELARSSAVVDLWESQVSALEQGILDDADHVVRMPTSAGKTRIAEFAILGSLCRDPGRLCVYVAPYLALAAEVRRSLRASLGGFGVRVSDLFPGEYALTELDELLIESSDVIITTPEKLDLLVRRDSGVLGRIGLFVFDEGHLIDDSERGIRYEFLLDRLRRLKMRDGLSYSVVLMSAVLPNADDLARWLAGSDAALVRSDWRPTAVRYGTFHWNGDTARGDVTTFGPEGQTTIPGVLRRAKRRTAWDMSSKGDICVRLAAKMSVAGPVAVFSATTRNVDSLTRKLSAFLVGTGGTLPIGQRSDQAAALASAKRIAVQYLGEGHPLTAALGHGFAYHTGKLPQNVRVHIERAYSCGAIRVLICTNTLAQGVNLPVKTLIIHSLQRSQHDSLSGRDFRNMAGRTGRAMRQLEGQVLFVHRDCASVLTPTERQYVSGRRVDSFVLSSVLLLYAKLSALRGGFATDHKTREVYRLIAGGEASETDMKTKFAALDAQLLGLLVEESADLEDVDLEGLLSGSLFEMQAADLEVDAKPIRVDLGSRISSIASDVRDPAVRQRYFATGFSTASCKTMDAALGVFRDLVADAPASPATAVELLAFLLELAWQLDETRFEGIGAADQVAVAIDWISGSSVSAISAVVGGAPTAIARFIEEALVRNLPWLLNGLAALAPVDHDESTSEEGWIRGLSGLLRYGVPNAAAAACCAVGITDRLAAIEMSRQCPNPDDLSGVLKWLSRLEIADLERFLAPDVAASVHVELLEAQLLNGGAAQVADPVEHPLSFWLAGLQFSSDLDAVRTATVGDTVSLVREPGNPVDPNAIRVVSEHTGFELGYVPRLDAKLIAPMIDEGFACSAQVVRVRRGKARGGVPAIRVNARLTLP